MNAAEIRDKSVDQLLNSFSFQVKSDNVKMGCKMNS